jgi:hypothetical protein
MRFVLIIALEQDFNKNLHPVVSKSLLLQDFLLKSVLGGGRMMDLDCLIQ